MSETSQTPPQGPHPNAAQLQSATKGFDHLFSNEIVEARVAFAAEESPFHLLGLGVCTFLEAALGMETALMTEATRCLTLSEAGARKQQKYAKGKANQRFPPGLEWEILNADAVVLLGLTHALSESYMGYFQCMYSLNRQGFTILDLALQTNLWNTEAPIQNNRLYKTVFPTGLNNYRTPAASPAVSRKSSNPSLRSVSLSSTPISSKSSVFGRFSSSTLGVPPKTTAGNPNPVVVISDGPVEELIVAGTAFGFGLFNLVFSLLPKKIQSVVGFFGFKHDRKLALQALAVSAAMKDVHSVFAGLVLMTYYGVVLLLSGYQADESHILKQYRAIVDSIESRYPMGALWILNRAKILRMSHDADSAIRVLRDGLKPERPHAFAQADTLLVFELAWTLLSQRRYQESADMFIKITELNSWSHATYYYIAAGCYISLRNYAKAKELFDTIPNLIDKRRINGRELPTEVLIKKKLEFYREKQRRRGGLEAEYVEAIKISPADEIAIFWNTHTRVQKSIAECHIIQWAALSPSVTVQSPHSDPDAIAPTAPVDLDTSDELALRSLLVGIAHRTAGSYESSRAFLTDAHMRLPEIKVSTWIGGVALFELAVLDLRETEAAEKLSLSDADGPISLEQTRSAWVRSLKSASDRLDQAMALDSSSTDLSSRLDSRITMLRDEIGTKREMLGLV